MVASLGPAGGGSTAGTAEDVVVEGACQQPAKRLKPGHACHPCNVGWFIETFAALSCTAPALNLAPSTPPAVQREEERKAAAAALMDEVARGNAELAERKRQQRVAEVEENRRIAEYIRQRDQREQVGAGAGHNGRQATGTSTSQLCKSGVCEQVSGMPTAVVEG